MPSPSATHMVVISQISADDLESGARPPTIQVTREFADRARNALRNGDFHRAVLNARRTLTWKPENCSAWNVTGVVALYDDDLARAMTAFGRAEALDDGPRSVLNTALALDRSRQWHGALDAYRRVLRRLPGHPKALERIAVIAGHLATTAGQFVAHAQNARRSGAAAEAEALLRRALTLEPHSAAAFMELHRLWMESKSPDQRLRALHRAVAVAPDHPDAYAHLSSAVLEAGNPTAAEYVARRCLAIRPEDAEFRMGHSEILLELGRLNEAEAASAEAKRLTGAKDPRAVYQLAYVRLLRGDLGRGFDGYMARWAAYSDTRTFPVPIWDGRRPLNGRLYLWSPSGVGDQVLFASMLNDVRTAGLDAIVECDPRWRPVWQRSFPWARIVDRPQRPDEPIDAEGAAAHFPIAGLGRWYRRDMSAFPKARRSYLAADAEYARRLRQKYRRLGGGPLIGLSWNSRNQGLGKRKSIPLADWAPILTARGASAPVFINLQYGDCRSDIDAAREAYGVSIFSDPEIDQMTDLDAFAAQVTALDHVISVSNTAAHVAGALGKPCWLLAPYGRATLWHWFAERTDSPWYPSMRIFRQPVQAGWETAIQAIATELKSLLDGEPGQPHAHQKLTVC